MSQLRKRLIGEFTLGRLVKSLLFIYAAVGLYLFFFADRMIFIPPDASYGDNASVLAPILKVTTEKDRLISAVYLENPEAAYTLLYSHGNAADLGQMLPKLLTLQNAGFSVFAYDYQGYGTSEGRPSERGTYRDIEAAYRYLSDQLGVSPDRIIVHGQSVGGGPSAYLASRQPVAGLILESTFTKIFRVVVPVKLFPFEKYPSIDRLRQVSCPVLVIHGTADSTIPLRHGQQLYQAANPPKQLFEVAGAGHNDLLLTDEAGYIRAIQTFSRGLE